MDTFHEEGLSPPAPTIVCSTLSMYFALLNSGPFLAMMPRSVLAFSTARQTVKTLSVKLPVKSLPVGIVTLHGRTLSPAAQLFIKTAREVASSV